MEFYLTESVVPSASSNGLPDVLGVEPECTPEGDGAVWDELGRRVDKMVDGEVFRCIELLSLGEQSHVAQLVRSLLRAQLERARASSKCATSVVEDWHRVVGPLDAELLRMARCQGPARKGSGSMPSSPAMGPKEPPVLGGAAGLSGKKRRRVELSFFEDEDEFLQLAEAGDAEGTARMLAESSEPRRLLNCTSEGGLTALHHAAFSGNESLARRLLELKADPDKRTDYGFTVLMASVQSQNLGLVSTLIEHRAAVDAVTDFDGRTALHLCAAAGDLDLCQALLAASADTRLKDRKGLTATDKARENGHSELVKLLELTDSSVATPRSACRDEVLLPRGPPGSDAWAL